MKICFTGNVFPFGEGFAYGGERILYYLIQELSKLGHEIYLFSREGTNVPARYLADYIPVGPLEADRDVHYEAVCDYVDKTGTEFDIYQCNYFGDGWDKEIIDMYPYVELTWCIWAHIPWQLKQKAFNTISYSKVMQDDFKGRGIDTFKIPYGIPKDLYDFEPTHDDYAVWIGKIENGKAPDLAIKLAKAAGMKIVILAPPYNTGCFWEKVYPYIDNKSVFWFRGVDDAQKRKIMSRAKVFISSNGNVWKEHFGIVNIESLAMGVPILGFSRINQECAIKVDEIIHDGKEGFLLEYFDSEDVEEIIEKGLPRLKRIGEISRQQCRNHFEKRFTSELMAKRYDWLYQNVAKGIKYESGQTPF